MRINDPDERDELITKMAIKYDGWTFKIWLIWFMQNEDFTIGPTEIGRRLGGLDRSNVGRALRHLRSNGDLFVVSDDHVGGHPVPRVWSPSTTNVVSHDPLTSNQETKTPAVSNSAKEIRSTDYSRKLQFIVDHGSDSWVKFAMAMVEKSSLTKPMKKRIDEAYRDTQDYLARQNVNPSKREDVNIALEYIPADPSNIPNKEYIEPTEIVTDEEFLKSIGQNK
jgi:hypothetical protein